MSNDSYISDDGPIPPAYGGRGGGFGGGGFGGGGRGGGRWMGGRKFSAAELQLLILRLLEDGPAHGYQLIRRLEELSQGFYAPSPGVIYPALTFLDEIGQAEAEADGKRKLYRITPDGHARLHHHRAAAEALLGGLHHIGQRMDRMREAWSSGGADADPALAETLTEERHRAHMALKSAVRGSIGCSVAEARRITDILNRAAAQIVAGPPAKDIP